MCLREWTCRIKCYLFLQDDVLRYDIVPDEAGNKTLEFFWINEADGEIVVKRLLSESPLSSFSVSIM